VAQYQFPSPLTENRSDEREVFDLVNALRRAVMQLTAGGSSGLALFSTAIGRGDGLTTKTDGVELVGLPFALPAVYPAFTINLGGYVNDSASNGTFRIRTGGTYGVADGTVIATMHATSTGFTYKEVSAVVTGNTETLIQMTLQSTVGHIALFKGGFLIGN
jgi:hypothetical protein